jgi:protein-tyrosine phosphatase
VALVRVLFVCMGNICRSPTAEGVFRFMVEEVGLRQQVDVDSAGTSDYQMGDPPDRRAQLAAQRRGYDLSRLRARQVTQRDFATFDYILAMDKKNLADLKSIYPVNGQSQLSLFLDYSKRFPNKDVPDPYYGGTSGFEYVLDQVEDASRGLIDHLLANGIRPSTRAR